MATAKTTKTTKPKAKAKVTLADLRAKPAKAYITIPGEAEPCTWFLIKNANNDEFLLAANKIAQQQDDLIETTDVSRVRQLTAELLATIVVGWDEEVFGEFNKDTVIEILNDPDYYYVPEQIGVASKRAASFHYRGEKPST